LGITDPIGKQILLFRVPQQSQIHRNREWSRISISITAASGLARMILLQIQFTGTGRFIYGESKGYGRSTTLQLVSKIPGANQPSSGAFEYEFFSDILPGFIDCLNAKSADILLIFSINCHSDCLPGLFGLAALQPRIRTKEIGIRKDAWSFPSLELSVFLLEIIDQWVLVATLIAWPVGLVRHGRNGCRISSIERICQIWIFILAGKWLLWSRRFDGQLSVNQACCSNQSSRIFGCGLQSRMKGEN
jgi:hypothetical protein